MKILPNLSLRFKFIVPLVIFTILITSAISYIAVQRFYVELEDQLVDRGRDLTSELFGRFWLNVGNLDPLPLSTRVHGYVVVRNGANAHVANAPLEAIEMHDPPKFLETPVEPSRKTVEFNGRQFIELIRLPDPGIIQPDEQFNAHYVKLYLSLDEVNKAVGEAFFTIAMIAGISIIFGTLIIIWLFRGILGPIEALTKSVKRFKHDLHVRAEIKTGDELETLGYEFNRMANAIQVKDENLEHMNAELTKANDVKSEFLAVMGHELKTPIHGIRGYAQLMLEQIDGPITEAQRRDLENIMESGDHLRALIDNILQFSKLESGQESIHPHPVEVGDLVNEAMKNVSVIARQQEIELRNSVNGVKINADETKLKQVFINLLSNALKYTKGGTVEIITEDGNDEIIFAVKDNGVGIAPEMFEKVFEPFTQIDSSTTRDWGGIGLGLSIVKKYIEMHGGRIWIESEVGKGTTFYFTIPTAMELSEVSH